MGKQCNARAGAAKSTPEPFAGAGGMVAPANAGNATGAIYWAVPIASFNWTTATENATRTGCMKAVRFANE